MRLSTLTPTYPLGKTLLLLCSLICAPLNTSYAADWVLEGYPVKEKSYCFTEVEAKRLMKRTQVLQKYKELYELEKNSPKPKTYYTETAAVAFASGLVLGITIFFGAR